MHFTTPRCRQHKDKKIDKNIINSECGQDTLPCQISGPFYLAFFRNYPETPKITCFLLNVFCKYHEIWVKALCDIAPRCVKDRQTDRRTNRQTKAFREQLKDCFEKMSSVYVLSPLHSPCKDIKDEIKWCHFEKTFSLIFSCMENVPCQFQF